MNMAAIIGADAPARASKGAAQCLQQQESGGGTLGDAVDFSLEL